MTALVAHSPVFGTPEYSAYLEAQFVVEDRTERTRRFVLPKAVYVTLLTLAPLVGLFGLAALTDGFSVLHVNNAPVQVEVVPADQSDTGINSGELVEVSQR